MANEFDLTQIETALRGFQDDFHSINARLSLKRDDLTNEIVENILCAYGFLNGLIRKNVDLFSLAGLHSMMELNHRVLCGGDVARRFEYHHHILETRRKFHEKIRPIRAWMIRNADRLDAYKIGTGFYCRMLCQPQLFIEGNHRTGNIVLNYILLREGQRLFVVTRETAYDYFELSGAIKFTNKGRWSDNFLKMPSHYRNFEAFLRRAARSEYHRDS